MVKIVVQWLPEWRTLHFAGDREYVCRTVLRDLEPSIEFTDPMPMNASLYGPTPEYSGSGRPRVHGARVPSPKKLLAGAPPYALG